LLFVVELIGDFDNLLLVGGGRLDHGDSTGKNANDDTDRLKYRRSKTSVLHPVSSKAIMR
jgi:hypothetical protein